MNRWWIVLYYDGNQMHRAGVARFHWPCAEYLMEAGILQVNEKRS